MEDISIPVNDILIKREMSIIEKDIMLKRLIPFTVRDNIIYIPEKLRTCMRGKENWSKEIGKNVEDIYVIDKKKYKSYKVKTIHPYAASVAFFPFLDDIFKALNPKLFTESDRVYYVSIQTASGFYDSKDGESCHNGIATLLIQE